MTEAIVASVATEPSLRPLAVLLVPLVTVGLIFLSKNRPNIREAWSILAAVTMFGIVASMVPDVLNGRVHETDLGFFVEGIELVLRADGLGMLFALVASGLYVVTAIYSIGYMRGHHEPFQTRFFAMLCASVGAALGVAFASNLFMLLVFYEVLTLATYPLVAHDESEKARVSGYKYLAYALSGGLAVFGGMLAVYWLTDPSTITFTRGGIEGLATVAAADPWAARGAFALLAGGFAVKAAVMPLHSWLPSAMVAPTPVSGLLHAVAVVKAGAFGVARTIIDVFGPETVRQIGMGLPLTIAAGATILIASLFALRQDNLKARLAYSTIAQLSYIVLGLSLLSGMGLMGGLLHIPAHAFSKLTLFLCAGALYVELDVKYISEMAGVGKRMPVTMGAFGLASFSMAGIPLMAGFVSKWHLIWGGAEAGYLLVAPLLVLSGVLNVAYFWPIIYTAFFESEDDADQKPVLDNPFGGVFDDDAYLTDGGVSSDDQHEDDSHDDHHDDGHHARPELPPAGGWDRSNWYGGETTLLLVAPLVTTATLMFIFGVAPDYIVFFDLIEGIVDGALEVDN
ncbi:Mrp-type sodium/proton antiporter system subunit D1 [Natronomonas pharaonis DSM 2160]|uniref:Mrp-type sodium/proton antiporter system subunit D1 n=1 Tax=Natronomonas pharaonis (strain ATCC 35678 / DSM 2160 / CIP 103997 / JCM 8858 / NBRC 14720 / NCIMB 2260 / Gabara) TaxID=348780 RepID=A0A1U7EU69_NATPD|nr:cation:proton antiporter [Natronomonas pharaonis]CAI48506.1 Mrp-type sodium/proton antiporter system subunit D1 [Natronomonas pharaonis DSM 2160]